MDKRKICVVLVNRANYGRVKSVLKAIQAHSDLTLQLVVGSSMLLPRFGTPINVVESEGFTVQARVNYVVEGQTPTTMAISTGLGIVELATVFENLQPDIVLVVADRYDAMAAALAAAYMNIPLAHIQGGEVSGSVDEGVRHAITRLAHIHFPATELSARRLIAMGEATETVYLVGCPAIDLVCQVKPSLNGLESILNEGYRCSFDWHQPYLLVLQHPVTTEYAAAAWQITETLKAIELINLPAIMLMPNVDAGGGEMEKAIKQFQTTYCGQHIRFFKNFAPEHYAQLLARASCIVGNSSSAIREGSFLGTPAVNIGNRQANREQGVNVVNVGYDRQAIVEAIQWQMVQGRYPQQTLYGQGTAGQQIADILARIEIKLQKCLVLPPL